MEAESREDRRLWGTYRLNRMERKSIRTSKIQFCFLQFASHPNRIGGEFLKPPCQQSLFEPQHQLQQPLVAPAVDIGSPFNWGQKESGFSGRARVKNNAQTPNLPTPSATQDLAAAVNAVDINT